MDSRNKFMTAFCKKDPIRRSRQKQLQMSSLLSQAAMQAAIADNVYDGLSQGALGLCRRGGDRLVAVRSRILSPYYSLNEGKSH